MKDRMLSYSGGKNSGVLLDLLIKGKIDGYTLENTHIVFADTLFEYPEMYDYIDFIENYYNIKIVKLKPVKDFYEWFYSPFTRGKLKGRRRGFPYVIKGCYWARDAKLLPLIKFQKENGVTESLIGYTVDEEKRYINKKTPIIKERYPLVELSMTDNDCRLYLDNLGILNPLYKKYNRLGCWFCPKQPNRDIQKLKDDYPELYDQLLILERDSPHKFKPNVRISDLVEK